MSVEFDIRPVALDAFVFLLHVDNPVDDLPLTVIHDIYTGEITTWTEASGGMPTQGEGDEIHTYQRNLNSGSQELMEQLVMKGDPMVESPELILETMMGPIHALGGNPSFELEKGDPLGIGYSVYYYATFMFPHEKVKLIAVDGVSPTSENIASRDYPLWTEVYVVVRVDQEPDSTTLLLRDWLLTEDGQAAIAESGYVPIQ
jgi:phosphate transport system substrate-binding protein